MKTDWFRPRGYRHFDAAICNKYAAQVVTPAFVARHSWSPLISYLKEEKRYKPELRKTIIKNRTIMYASHRDACILSYYASTISTIIDERYKAHGLDDSVIAYRSLGKSNYHFAADALGFAQNKSPCIALCFDVTGFFDNIDHKLLKRELSSALGTAELPADWYAVFKNITKFRNVTRDSLKGHSVFGERLKSRSHEPVATISEVKAAGISILTNPNTYGIPQGTPISAVLSNVYMWSLDIAMEAACAEHGALYRRYSDDILLICSKDSELYLTSALTAALEKLKLEIKEAKTERREFDAATPASFQYLGFNISPEGAVIRPGSLARQWRKARRSIRRTKKRGEEAIAAGSATKIYTKKLRQRFLPIGLRNFSSYARRSAAALGSDRIVKQVRRLERMVDNAIKDMQ